MVLVFTVMLAILFPLSVAHANTVFGQTYQVDHALSPGTIVSMNGSNGSVAAADINNIANLFGVVISSDQSLLTFSSPVGNQVQVASTGVADIFVSDINGDIKAGDPITVSTITGVGMKATQNAKIIGIAQESLSGSAGKKNQNIVDSTGKSKTVQLGSVQATIDLSYYYKEASKSVIPIAFQSLANSIAGKQVSPIPILVCLAIFIIGLGSICALLYGAIRGTIISVGRNPMAQAAVYRNLIQVSVLILGILGAIMVSIYLILAKL